MLATCIAYKAWQGSCSQGACSLTSTGLYAQRCEWRNAGSSHLTQIKGLFLEDVTTEQVQEDSRNQAHPVENPGGGKRMVSLGLSHRNQRLLEMRLVVIRCGCEESEAM